MISVNVRGETKVSQQEPTCITNRLVTHDSDSDEVTERTQEVEGCPADDFLRDILFETDEKDNITLSSTTARLCRFDSNRNDTAYISKLLEHIKSRCVPSVHQDALQILESLLFTIVSSWAKYPNKKNYNRWAVSLTKSLKLLHTYCDERNTVIDYAKFQLGCLQSRVMTRGNLVYVNPPPSSKFIDGKWVSSQFPDAQPLFSGIVKRFLDRKILKGDTPFIVSLYQSKRAWPLFGEQRIKDALNEHKNTLCSAEPIEEISDQLRCELNRAVIGCFGTDKRNKSKISDPTKFLPTGSGCVQFPRSKGGTGQSVEQFEPEGSVSRVSFKDGKIVIQPSMIDRFGMWKNKSMDSVLAQCRSRVAMNDETLLHVDVDYIMEPAKVRVLSKMDGFLASALQPLQGQLTAGWKKHVGNTMKGDIDVKVQNLYSNTPREWVNYSVDYKSATDKLKVEVTQELMRSLSQMGLVTADIAIASFREALMKYPPELEDTGERHQQTNGQLMGHPLSFVLLCLTNVACFHSTLLSYSRLGAQQCKDAEIMWNRYLINGDDLLFRGPEDPILFEIFLQKTKDAGLITTVGKTYISKRYGMINSRIYYFNDHTGKVTRKGYLNLNLLKGNAEKDKSPLTSATPESFSKDYQDMVSLYPPGINFLSLLFKRWTCDQVGDYRLTNPHCKNHFKGRYIPNWFLPVHLGGFGVNPKYSQKEKIKITKDQRVTAAIFFNDPSRSLFYSKNLNSKVMDFSNLYLGTPKISPHSEATPPKGEVDEWMVTMEGISRAAGLHTVAETPEVFRSNLRKKNKDFRLSAMSAKGLLRNWVVDVSYPCAPQCPKPSIIKIRKMDGDHSKGFIERRSIEFNQRKVNLFGFPFKLSEPNFDEY